MRHASRASRPSPPPTCPPCPNEGYAFEDDGKQITWRLEVGHRHGATPGNIVGAIANEARLSGQQINGVDVRATYTLVRLPAMLPKAVLERLAKVRIRGQALAIDTENAPRANTPKPHRKGAKRP